MCVNECAGAFHEYELDAPNISRRPACEHVDGRFSLYRL